jgi:site-specific recombinase XerD
VRRSKTRAGRRTIPLPPALPTLTKWLAHRGALGLDRPETLLLCTRHGSPLKHSFVWGLVKRLAHRAHIRPPPGHTAPHQPGCGRGGSFMTVQEAGWQVSR